MPKPSSKKAKEKCIIIDGNSLIHRAFHALPPLSTKDGLIVNAVYGFLTIFFKVLKDIQPTYVAMTFDKKGPTFRHKIYKEYKGTRKKQPDELYVQIDIIKDIVRQLGIATYEQSGVEADDVIGTLTTHIPQSIDTYIVTGDLDALQLIDKHTFVITMRKGMSDVVVYDAVGVEEKFNGLQVKQLIDYKALRGDTSDNIPGVKGIGEKTATELLLQYKTLGNIYKHLADLPTSVHKKLEAGQELAELSHTLGTIKRDVDLEFTLTDTTLQALDYEVAKSIVQQYEFNSLLATLSALSGNAKPESVSDDVTQVPSTIEYTLSNGYTLVDSESAVKDLRDKLKHCKIFAFDTETTGLDPLQCELVGCSISWQSGKAYYITADYVKFLKIIFENSAIKKVGHNGKFDIKVLRATLYIKVEGFAYDTMLASYVLHPGSRGHSLDNLALTEFGHEMIPYESLVGKGKNEKSIKDVPLLQLAEYAAEDADYTWRLYEQLKPRVQKAELETVLDLEVKLTPILVDMEFSGIAIDSQYLGKLSTKLAKQIQQVQDKIYKTAGKEFNISSPKQLAEILFEDLKIDRTGIAKTKTGLSTAATELEKMRSRHPIISMISEYREFTKLKSTYVDTLPKLVNPKSGRVHTNYNQTIAATGRLSSTDPNLQNIPIRTELGKKIRGAFVAPPGKVLLSLDYSQIELRIVADMANDASFIAAFKAGADVHTRTAAELNDIPESEVTSTLRREAKSVNFGLLYGMGVKGLQRDTEMTLEEARDYLDRYFAKHPAIRNYIDSTKEKVHTLGYAESLFGRKRFLPDIKSSMPQVRAAAERAAINMPIQGTAADIMKLAMLDVAKLITEQQLPVTMLLQVHDELVFEVAKQDAKRVAPLLQYAMEQVHSFKVPLVVDVGMGENWYELHNLA